MKPNPFSLFSAILMALPMGASAQIFSWETGLDGWTANNPGDGNAIATSTIGATDGLQSLQVTQPMANMWYSVPTAVGLSGEQLQSIFTDATNLKIDVSYPNPGYNSWTSSPSVEFIIQGSNVGWAPLGAVEVAVDGAPQTVTIPLTVAQAAGMATSTWGQLLLKFTYGNGGATSSSVVFYVDNLTSTIVPDVLPETALYWKGDVDASWASGNWTSDAAGTVPPVSLPTDGSVGIAFSATGAGNLSTDLGGVQSVRHVAVLDGVEPVSISGSDSLTLGSGGIWMADTAGSLTIDSTGGVILAANQVWKNSSPSATLTVNSAISGSLFTLSKSGAGPVLLGAANTYDGGTIVQLGTLILGDNAALGVPGSSLFMEGGTLDLNGFSPTIGALSGNPLGVIHNSSSTPCVLTLGSADVDSAYSCFINDGPGGGAVSVVKKGVNVTSNIGGGFTGDMTIQEGQFIANASPWDPTITCFGNAQFTGGQRKVIVESTASILFNTNNILGNASVDPLLLPEFILNEGSTLDSNRYNTIGKVTLNGGTLTNNSSDTGAYGGYQFRGEVIATGSTASNIGIGSDGKGCHLSASTTFTVEDVTGDGAEDLIISAPLLDQSGDFASAAGGLIKEGDGTLALQGACTYTGDTLVRDGDLSLYFESLSDTSTLEVAADAKVNLYFDGTDTVGALVLGGETMPIGTYGADHESGLISGIGFIQVVGLPDHYAAWIATFPTLVEEEDTARGADPDADGLTNAQEFALNSNPADGAPSGKVRSSVETVSSEQALVLTLPVRDGAVFNGNNPATATLSADKIGYQIEGTNDLTTFDQAVSEVVPAATSGLPELDTGWTYRSFRLDGNIGGGTPRGPKGFLRAMVMDTP